MLARKLNYVLPKFEKFALKSILENQVISALEKAKQSPSISRVTVLELFGSTNKINNVGGRSFTGAKANGNAKVGDVSDAMAQLEKYSDAVNIIHRGLEALKLGRITVEYVITGTVNKTGDIGAPTDGRKRQIFQLNHSTKALRIDIKAYSYRGFRQKDPEQGAGISFIKSKAVAAL